jgi:hypothetical protein
LRLAIGYLLLAGAFCVSACSTGESPATALARSAFSSESPWRSRLISGIQGRVVFLLITEHRAAQQSGYLRRMSFRRACAFLAAAMAAMILLPPALAASRTGPTLYLAYRENAGITNTVAEFMYFVPLISPGPVSSVRNAGNTQRARIVSLNCQANDRSFHASCEFDFIGQGCQRHVFDHSENTLQHEQTLKNGEALEKQLTAIIVQGGGSGVVEVEGVITNGVRQTKVVRLRFNHRHTSPVFVELSDIYYDGKEYRQRNQLTARVNTLTFRRTTGPARMEISLASVNKKGAKSNLWQSVVGDITGAAVNLFIPPVPVEMSGLNTMLDFGGALAGNAASFTFPLASRLKADLVE